MSPKTAQLKKTSDQRCREAFDAWYQETFPAHPQNDLLPREVALMRVPWNACWKFLENRLLEEIQS